MRAEGACEWLMCLEYGITKLDMPVKVLWLYKFILMGIMN